MSNSSSSEKFKGLEFYRCTLCNGVVSDWDIDEHHGCPTCAGTRLRVTNLNLVEKLIQIIKHPRVWRWSDPSYVRPNKASQ